MIADKFKYLSKMVLRYVTIFKWNSIFYRNKLPLRKWKFPGKSEAITLKVTVRNYTINNVTKTS